MRHRRRRDHQGRDRPPTGNTRRPAGTTSPVAHHHAHPRPSLEVADDQLMRLMYTSGTESRPKGVMHSSRSLMSNYVSTIVAGSMSVDDIEIHSMPLYHCAQLDNFLATDIYLGATSIILPRPDPEAILRGIERIERTNYFAPPTIWIAPASLTRCSTRSTCPACARATTAPRRCRPRSCTRSASGYPTSQLWNFYGQTEMAPLASALGPAEQRDHAGAAGRPAINVETAILDDTDTPVPPGNRRRDRTPWPAPDARLPRRSRAHR